MYSNIIEDEKDIENFFSSYEIYSNSDERNAIIMIYFALTTLTSVGFGDFHPKTTSERVFIIIVFMITILLFSSIVNCMQTYFEDFQTSFEEPDESNKLAMFF